MSEGDGLPRTAFDVIAVDLCCVASLHAYANEQMEFAVAGSDEPAFARVLGEARRTAESIGTLHRLFHKVAPFEAEFRATVEDFLRKRGIA